MLLPPLTGLEALETRVSSGMLVIQARLSLNMAAHTLEQVGPCLASPSPASPSPAHPARPNPARPSPARPNPARPRPARPSPVSPNLRTKRAFALAPTRDQARICPSSNPPLGPSHCKPALERTGALSPAQDADGYVRWDRPRAEGCGRRPTQSTYPSHISIAHIHQHISPPPRALELRDAVGAPPKAHIHRTYPSHISISTYLRLRVPSS